MELLIIVIFCFGYLFIAIEHVVDINKTATALVTGVLCWTVYVTNNDPHEVTHQLLEQLGEISSILFFLMGAMTIVELIDSHDGFEIINRLITTKSRRRLLWIICFITFFLSAILDNLTTTIVMVTICVKLVRNQHYKLVFIGMIIIAANAGGAWSPIGDVTTTMLWIGGQISTVATMKSLIVPSLVSLLVPLVIVSRGVEGQLLEGDVHELQDDREKASVKEQRLILSFGIGSLLFVPAFKTVTHLPPFMGMLLGLGILWIITEIIHRKKDKKQREKLSVISALEHMDVPSVLFFLGILLAVGVLQATGQLTKMADILSQTIKNDDVILGLIGIVSAVVDNVPIVAATMGMYSLSTYTQDHPFWQLLAFCAGTGGSLLIIGSAAGIAAMGLQKISFGWYLKHISWLAMIGYFAGIIVFLIQKSLT